ncbi:MAG: SPASM domain-containing protein [Blautia sp.]|nr:SPASM domain-containing protein [Blautia sp.]
MVYRIIDKKHKFVSYFNSETGAYMRTGILDKDGKDTGKDPFMGSFPNLIDVGVMGHCIHGKMGLCTKAGIGCYQSGLFVEKPNMSVDDFKWITEQCRHKCNQFALGGRGDPDQHEHFEELLKICRENDIVPNFTTSGYGMTSEIARICKEYCGAVAVSWYRSDYTKIAIQRLTDAGVKTNIHYVLGNNTIDEAIERLRNNSFPEEINAVVFLLHKPAGQGTQENILSVNDPRTAVFFKEADRIHPYKIGFDSCNVPGVLQFCRNILPQSLDTCEGARFSCYIDSDMTMLPCSFDQKRRYAVSLRDNSIEEAWNSDTFEQFRTYLRNSCQGCEKKELCMGGCPLMPEIVFCDKPQRNIR